MKKGLDAAEVVVEIAGATGTSGMVMSDMISVPRNRQPGNPGRKTWESVPSWAGSWWSWGRLFSIDEPGTPAPGDPKKTGTSDNLP
jgi:hypothetical protein